MKLLDLLRMIFDNLNRRKSRVALTAVGVVIGTASVVLLISLANGMQQNTASQIGNMGDLTTIYVYPGMPMEVSARSGGGMGAPLENPLNGEAIEQIGTLPGIEQIIPRADLMAVRRSNLESWRPGRPLSAFPSRTPAFWGTPQRRERPSSNAVLRSLEGGRRRTSMIHPCGPGQEPPPPPDLVGHRCGARVIFKYSRTDRRFEKPIPSASRGY